MIFKKVSIQALSFLALFCLVLSADEGDGKIKPSYPKKINLREAVSFKKGERLSSKFSRKCKLAAFCKLGKSTNYAQVGAKTKSTGSFSDIVTKVDRQGRLQEWVRRYEDADAQSDNGSRTWDRILTFLKSEVKFSDGGQNISFEAILPPPIKGKRVFAKNFLKNMDRKNLANGYFGMDLNLLASQMPDKNLSSRSRWTPDKKLYGALMIEKFKRDFSDQGCKVMSSSFSKVKTKAKVLSYRRGLAKVQIDASAIIHVDMGEIIKGKLLLWDIKTTMKQMIKIKLGDTGYIEVEEEIEYIADPSKKGPEYQDARIELKLKRSTRVERGDGRLITHSPSSNRKPKTIKK